MHIAANRLALGLEQRIVRRCPHTTIQLRSASSKRPEQANPIGDYYASILTSPQPSEIQHSPEATIYPVQRTYDGELLDRARTVFGTRIPEPEKRRAEISSKSTLIAGVWVPPRPAEPDNCCMSGCVNCVWDLYRDELEEWAAASKQANANLKKEQGLEKGRKLRRGGSGLAGGGVEKGALHTAVSMDDDGGGSETNWSMGSAVDGDSEDLFKGVPVGILEFMKQEKRLKEKHAKEGSG